MENTSAIFACKTITAKTGPSNLSRHLKTKHAHHANIKRSQETEVAIVDIWLNKFQLHHQLPKVPMLKREVL